MIVMAVCALMVLIGLVVIVRWGALDFVPPPVGDEPAAVRILGAYVWYLDVAVASGVVSGLLMAGAGGRLIMRLLAVTAGPDAQGRITEADQMVGRISVGDTIALLLFGGVFAGVLSAAAYVLLRRWLPRGRLAGIALGAGLLVTLSTRIDPLRADNPDFGIVGPGWLAIATYGALALLQGMLVAAIANRYSRLLRLPSRRFQTLAPYAPLLLLIPGLAIGLFAIAGALIATAVAAIRPLREALLSRPAAVVVRVLLLAILAVSLPGFVRAIAHIAGT